MIDRLEKAFKGTRFCGKARIDAAASRWKSAVQVPVMARLSQEGMVALGDVFAPCVAIADLPLPGRKPATIDVLVLDFSGRVSVVACALRGKGATAGGAARLAEADKRLRDAASDAEGIESLYRKTAARAHARESITDLAASATEECMSRTIALLPGKWADCIGSGRTALYLAMDRRPETEIPGPMEPLAPMTALLEARSGGMFEIETPPAPAKEAARYLNSLEEPSRTIWLFRRKMG